MLIAFVYLWVLFLPNVLSTHGYFSNVTQSFHMCNETVMETSKKEVSATAITCAISINASSRVETTESTVISPLLDPTLLSSSIVKQLLSPKPASTSVLTSEIKKLKTIKAKNNKKDVEINSLPDPHVYIIIFHKYDTVELLELLIETILLKVSQTEYKILPRVNPAQKYPTDFILLELHSQMKKILNVLKHNPKVKYVTKNHQIKRNLNWLTDSEISRLQRFRTRGTFIDEFNKLKRRRNLMASRSITDELKAKTVWDAGYSGSGIKIAIFDTGLSPTHPHFRNIEERTNWTDEKKLTDTLGHGTFVAGLIASQTECKGFAPDAQLHFFRVFNTKQSSYTSWFLDAFNYAIATKVNVLNLSIGGPDFLDQPFVDKIREMSANNIIVVSAIGNDGPLYGTLNNPADQLDVIGVGGIKWDESISPFSSRGMTTWELPSGYGRIKPDLVAFSHKIEGSKRGGSCRKLSGTSVASPIVAGAVVLLASVVPPHRRKELLNVAVLKQVLVETAIRVPKANIFEQGMGKINIPGAFERIKSYEPRASVFPSNIDLTDCPYMWPYCTQHLYYGAMPVIMNLTILNGMSVSGHLDGDPIWKPDSYLSDVIDVTFDYPAILWPYSGYLGVLLRVKNEEKYAYLKRRVVGNIHLVVVSSHGVHSPVDIKLTLDVIPTPPRTKRLLWDQFHNLGYPLGYFPRDNLGVYGDILDWNGDHPHTNFKPLFDYVQSQGYFMEVLGSPLTCFNASQYSTLFIVDSEDEFFPEEIDKLTVDITKKGLSLIVLAEWYNTAAIRRVKFFDQNTKESWTPVTGGSNVPALNDLLHPYGISFGGNVIDGTIRLEGSSRDQHKYKSGTSIVAFPSGGYIASQKLKDKQKGKRTIAFLGALDMKTMGYKKGGRIVVYGDSTCFDMNHNTSPGGADYMMGKLLNFTSLGKLPESFFPQPLSSDYRSIIKEPIRHDDGKLMKIYSRVLKDRSSVQCVTTERKVTIHNTSLNLKGMKMEKKVRKSKVPRRRIPRRKFKKILMTTE